jgi:hypothetical protein
MVFQDILKKRLLLLAVVLGTVIVHGQGLDRAKLKFKSWSVTPLEVYDFANRDNEMFSGLTRMSITLDASYALQKHLFSISGSYGQESGIFSGSASYKQLSLLYGREFELKEWLFAETHLGGGLFFYGSSDTPTYISAFAVPIVGKIRFKTGERFSIGLRFTYLFNSFNNLYAGGLSLQWNY